MVTVNTDRIVFIILDSNLVIICFQSFAFVITQRKNEVPFSMAIGNEELMHECCPQHLYMDKRRRDNMERSREGRIKRSPDGLAVARAYLPDGSLLPETGDEKFPQPPAVLYHRSSVMVEHRCCDAANLVSVSSSAGNKIPPRAES